MASRKHRQQGIALVMVLWALVVLSVIAASLTHDTRSQLSITRNLLDGAQAEAAADAGIYRAVAALLAPAERRATRVDGTIYAWQFENNQVRIRIWDEGGKIDINGADQNLLASLFEAAGEKPETAQTLADRVIDYRDPDHLRRLHGAEDDDYARAGLAYGAKDAPFAAIEELNLVLGMTPEIYARVADAITVFTRRQHPDARFAPPLVATVLAAETAKNGRPRREVLRPREDRQDAKAAMEAVGDLQVIALGPSAGRSFANTFTIHSEARTATGAVFAREAVVRFVNRPRGGDRFRFMIWERGDRELFNR